MAWWNPFSSGEVTADKPVSAAVSSERKDKKIDNTGSIMVQQSFEQSPTGAAVTATIKEAKKDWQRVCKNYDEEGATPAVLDTVATVGNVGKNVLRGIKAHGDRGVEYTRTNIAVIDKTIGADGLGKVLSGTAGLITETVGVAGSLFSTEDNSTGRAAEKLVQEGSSVTDGLGSIIGKGWLWGKDDKKDTAKKQVAPSYDEPAVVNETTEEDPEEYSYPTQSTDSSPETATSITEEIMNLVEREISKPNTLADNSLQNNDKTVLSPQDSTKTSLQKTSDQYDDMPEVMKRSLNSGKTVKNPAPADTSSEEESSVITPEEASHIFANILAEQNGEPLPYPEPKATISLDEIPHSSKITVGKDLKDLLADIDEIATNKTETTVIKTNSTEKTENNNIQNPEEVKKQLSEMLTRPESPQPKPSATTKSTIEQIKELEYYIQKVKEEEETIKSNKTVLIQVR